MAKTRRKADVEESEKDAESPAQKKRRETKRRIVEFLGDVDELNLDEYDDEFESFELIKKRK